MNFVSEMFSRETPVSAAFYHVARTVTAGNVSAPVETWYMTKDVLFWRGSMSARLISEQIKTEVDGVVLIDYSTAASAVRDTDIVVIGSNRYQVIHADNVANQNEVIVIPVKRAKD